MAILSAKNIKWLRSIHILFVCAWIGASLSKMVLGHFHHFDALLLINMYVFIPGVNGTFITGLLFSLLAPWGFFRYHWITVKWIATLFLMIVGILVFATPVVENRILEQLFPTIQISLLIILVFISAHKPWGKRNTERPG